MAKCEVCHYQIDANDSYDDEAGYVRTPIGWIKVTIEVQKEEHALGVTLFDGIVCSKECAEKAAKMAMDRYDGVMRPHPFFG